MSQTETLHQTPLFEFHVAQGARMVPFAGYEMPVQYQGILAEHAHTREKAGLFDVSHMGQVIVSGPDRVAALERLIPVDLKGLPPGRQRYGFLLNDAGGILDDLMIANHGAHFCIVLNAACKVDDIAHLRAGLEGAVTLSQVEDRALLAVQGPFAEAALARLAPGIEQMRFMDVAVMDLSGVQAWVTRSGYTGEDGFEISLPAAQAQDLAERLTGDASVAPVGLGARDSLRLEAGLCLYGHDIDTTTSPIEAGLAWAIQKRRRAEGGFPGAARILAELESGPSRRRVGLRPEGRAPMREGVTLFATQDEQAAVGHITSGGFGATLGAPVAMGYVTADLAMPGTRLYGEVRGKRLPVSVAALPFTPANFKR